MRVKAVSSAPQNDDPSHSARDQRQHAGAGGRVADLRQQRVQRVLGGAGKHLAQVVEHALLHRRARQDLTRDEQPQQGHRDDAQQHVVGEHRRHAGEVGVPRQLPEAAHRARDRAGCQSATADCLPARDALAGLGIRGAHSFTLVRFPFSGTGGRSSNSKRPSGNNSRRVFGDQYVVTCLPRRGLDSRGRVHSVPNNREFNPSSASDRPRDHRARVHADAHANPPVVVILDAVGDLERRIDGAGGVVGSLAGAPNTASTPSPMNLFACPPCSSRIGTTRSQKPLSSDTTSCGLGLLGEPGEVADVQEQDADLDLLTGQVGALAQHPLGDPGIDVGAERFAQPLALLAVRRPSS